MKRLSRDRFLQKTRRALFNDAAARKDWHALASARRRCSQQDALPESVMSGWGKGKIQPNRLAPDEEGERDYWRNPAVDTKLQDDAFQNAMHNALLSGKEKRPEPKAPDHDTVLRPIRSEPTGYGNSSIASF